VPAWVLPARYRATATLVVNQETLPDGRAPKARPLSFYEELTRNHDVARAALRAAGEANADHDDVRALLRRVDGRMEINNRLLRVSVTGADPESAARLANAFGDSIVEFIARLNGQSARETLDFVQARGAEADERLAAARTALAAFDATRGLAARERGLAARLELAEEFEQKRQRILVERGGLEEAARSAARALEDMGPRMVVTRRLAETPLLAAGVAGVSDDDKLRLQVQDEVVNQSYVEMATLRGRVGVDLARSAGEARRLEVQIGANDQAIAALQKELGALRQERAQLDLAVKEAEAASRWFHEKMNDAQLFAGARQRELELFDRAVAPHRPAGPGPLVLGVTGLLAGLAAGVAAASWRSRRAPT
jgi:uncharacterized protein involved in exopolysaccharide biosynthesis